MTDAEEQIESVEIAVAEESVVESTTDQATVLLSLEELIKNHIQSLEKLQDELKKHRQMFADAFENNESMRELDKQVKEVPGQRANYQTTGNAITRPKN